MKLLRAPRKLQIIISSSKSWGNISRYHSCLYQYCTTSTHRIIERSFVFPAAQKNHRSSQRLLDRCLSCLTTISSLMECRTRSIDENMYFISHHKNTYFKRLMKHIFMPFIRSLRESANNCFLCDGLNCRSMWKDWSDTHRRDIYRCIPRNPLGPIYALNTGKKSIKRGKCNFFKLDIHAIGSTQPNIRLHHRPHITIKTNQSILTMRHSNPLTFEFRTYHPLHSWSTCCYKMHMKTL